MPETIEDTNTDIDGDDRLPRRTRWKAILGGVAVLALLLTPILLSEVTSDAGSGDTGDESAVASSAVQSLRDAEAREVETLRVAAHRGAAEQRYEDQRAAQQAAAEAAAAEAAAAEAAAAQAAAEQAAAEQAAAEAAAAEQAAAEAAAAEQAAAQAPTSADSGGGVGDPYSYATWDTLAQCESTGDWHINTGNGYYGGVQFSLSSWRAVGGSGYPHEHSRETQITMAIRLWEIQGWGAWPACTAELGWR
jgi:resuscitation-promoting factor RpfB